MNLPESQKTENHRSYVLGLDVGAESIGWAILACEDGTPTHILQLGTHAFDAGVEGDYESGKDQSRAIARRQARQVRRQTWRRGARRRKLLRLLQAHGLMPPGSTDTPEDIHALLLNLDTTVRRKYLQPGDATGPHVLPYRLRARALDHQLEPYELGRALYHLAQRRGFQSSRKARKPEEDREKSQVKADINQLAQEMQQAGARTLGEYFARLDPRIEKVRRRWTGRQMYKDEFEAIWSAQARHHPALNDELKQQVFNAIFYQRPLKPQSHLIGECELFPGHKCAPKALRVAQRFRLLQTVNNLTVRPPGQRERRLTEDERKCLIKALDTRGDLTFAKIRGKGVLNLPKGTTFNLEEGGEKRMPGNRTDAALAEIFGDRWASFTEEQRDQIVEDILTFEKEDALARKAQRVWGLDPQTAQKLAELELEPGYAQHCRKALMVLTLAMADGKTYAAVRRDEFPEQFAASPPMDMLPPVLIAQTPPKNAEARRQWARLLDRHPVLRSVGQLRNPAVCRALTELRKLVNAIVRRYGKPEAIRIELARDLKKTRQQRKETWQRIRETQKARDQAKARILREIGDAHPSRDDIEKVLLAEECNWECPYTGRCFGMRDILGKNPQFDVEHIWPFSRSMDNTFFNKTLCYHEENRGRKHDRMPFEAYSGDPQRWDEILQRVRRFRGDAARDKLQRFLAESIPEGFTLRQLTDTRYTARLATRYLGLLYGGLSDEEHKRRIQCRPAGLTAHIRNELMLNCILGDGDRKTRDDHRHHAIDAVAVALASDAMVQRLERAAAQAAQHNLKLFAPGTEPWPGFLDDVRQAIDAVNVSRRPKRGLSGPLHAESLYSKPIKLPDGSEEVHIRKELRKLSTTEVSGDQIVDPTIRKLVQDKWTQLGGGLPAKVFNDPANHPFLTTRSGRHIPIHKVRVRAKVDPWPIGAASRHRYVTGTPGSNHHMAIVAVLDKQGNERKWEGHLVTRYEAYQRKQNNQPVVSREWGENRRFRFSLAPGDMFTLVGDDGSQVLYVVRSISKNRVEFTSATDARTQAELKAAHAWKTHPPDTLRQRKCQKVRVSYLGELLPAND